MTDDWTRRAFLGRLARSGAAAALVSGAAAALYEPSTLGPSPTPRLAQTRDFRQGLALEPERIVVARVGTAAESTRAAIEKLGGMSRFVRPGEVVALKPNIGWDRTPAQAANTNPEVVATLIRLCAEAGAGKVIVTDVSCNEPRRAFTRSGIWQATEAAGGIVMLPAEHRFREQDIGGRILGRMPVLTPVFAADRLINVPLAKHHSLSRFTGAMKNLYGVLGGRRNRLHQRIDESIADLADFARATLTVMDATRVLVRGGPQGGSLDDVVAVGEVIAGVDPVAIDAYSCRHIGLEPIDLPYLWLAAARSIGQPDLARLSIEEIG
ncbi:MAG: DUF362 domain-containing protein [Myxococcota bacterium]|jgi:uncharacterized protein (DUF362 family)|nr:DUF362 domain-containing protein [Myxococcota bacterium]